MALERTEKVRPRNLPSKPKPFARLRSERRLETHALCIVTQKFREISNGVRMIFNDARSGVHFRKVYQGANVP